MKKFFLSSNNVNEVADETAKILRSSGAVGIVPTETVYGIVGLVTDKSVAERIYQLKQRQVSKQLGWFVHDWKVLADYGVILDGLPERLAKKYCPGPITIIAPRNDDTTLGFRSPQHAFLQALLAELDAPLFQTSANLSGNGNAKSGADAVSQLVGDVDVVVEAGELPPDAEASTVVDATGKIPKILRQGKLKIDESFFAEMPNNKNL